MDRHSLLMLLKKYREGKASEEEMLLVEKWYSLLGENSPVYVENDERAGIEQRMWEKINLLRKEESAQPSKVKHRTHRLVIRLSIAASIATTVLLTTIWLLPRFAQNQKISRTAENKIRYEKSTNNSAKVETVKLGDGSSIQLDPHASVSYPVPFNASEREIHLEGNAYFDVAKNPSQPFNVYSGNVVTRVLGTTFYIRSDKGTGKVEVSVRTGKVSVYETGKDETSRRTGRKMNNSGVVITPNQKVTYYPEQHHFITSIVDNPEIVEKNPNIARSTFIYEDVQVSSILAQLQKTYNIGFVLENENLNNCRFTGDIHQQDLYSKLDIICLSLGIDYEVKGTSILLKGKGCE